MSVTNQVSPDRRSQLWLGGVVVSCVLIILEFIGVALVVRNDLEKVSVPLAKVGGQVVRMSTYPWQILKDGYRSHQRIQDLELRYSETLTLLGTMQGLKEENEYLKSQVSTVGNQQDQVLITAPVISYGMPGVAAGSQQNIAVGNLVLLNQIVVGKITRVSSHQSTVELLSQSPQAWLLAKTPSGATGIIRGDGKQVLLTEVSQDDELKVGDLVLTLGQTGVERDITVGVVSQIKTQPTDAVQTAVVEQVVSFFESRLVEIRR